MPCLDTWTVCGGVRAKRKADKHGLSWLFLQAQQGCSSSRTWKAQGEAVSGAGEGEGAAAVVVKCSG